MEYYNLVIPVCMLMKAAAYCNILVSDVVKPESSFSLSLYCFFAENPKVSLIPKPCYPMGVPGEY